MYGGRCDKPLMKLLSSLAYDWGKCMGYKNEYLTMQMRKRKSKISEHLEKIDAAVLTLVQNLKEAAISTPTAQMNSSMLSTTFLKKSNAIKLVLANGAKLQALLNDSAFINNIKRRLKECENRSDNKILSHSEGLELFCENNTSISWDLVNDLLIDMENSRTITAPLNSVQLIKAADLISSNTVTLVNDLNLPVGDAAVGQLVKTFPVLYLRKGSSGYFINLHEFIYTPGVFDDILNPPSEHLTDIQQNPQLENIAKQPSEPQGQPSLVNLLPNLIDITTEFIKAHGFAAQNRRRTETGYSSGVTISQIQKHLIEKVPGLKEHGISESTVRRLFEPPNKRCNAHLRYKGHVQARVGAKSNTYHEYNEDAHYLFARNKQRRELAAMFPAEVTVISTDDMADDRGSPPSSFSFIAREL